MSENKWREWILGMTLLLSGPVFIALTSPRDLPLPLLIIPYIWLLAILFVATFAVLKGTKLSKKKVVALAIVVSGTPVLLSVFLSVSRLSFKDIVLAVIFVIVGVWYILYSDLID